MRMWMQRLQLVFVGIFLQVPGCFPSCFTVGPVAYCASKGLRSVPPLPSHITHLYLEMNRIHEINSSSFSGLTNLQELDLGRQLVPLVIRNNAFSGHRRLQTLKLGFNTGLYLEPQAFEGLSGLRNLHLDYCSLNGSILEDNYLEPLLSLQNLDLFGNQIKRLQPSLFFANMTYLKHMNLMLNKIDQICESDLIGFQGKDFTTLNLNSVYLKAMSNDMFDWQKCGNPFRGMSFQTLDMSNSGLSLVKYKLFFRAIRGTHISHLKLSGHIGRGFSFNNLPDPDRSTFEGLGNSSVLSLDLSKNRIFALKDRVFSPLREVAIIDVSQNRVNQIHRYAFQGLQGQLKLLNLSHNLLGEIYSDTFASLTNLKVLDLSHNHIGVLGYHSFDGLPNLKALFLTGNSIRHLGFPAALPSLDYLILGDNRLTSASVDTIIQFASNIKLLNIEDNRLTNLEDVYIFVSQLKHLQSLFSGGNRIRMCTPRGQIGSNNLQILDLHSSSLQNIWAQGQCLNLFDNLRHVISVRLSHNQLQTLPHGVFKGLSSVVDMDLSFNRLTYLHPDVFPKSLQSLSLSNNFIASPDPAAFHSLSFLDFSMNRFHCDVHLMSFLIWLEKTNVTLLSPAQELRCQFPAGLYNVPLLEYSTQVRQQ